MTAIDVHTHGFGGYDTRTTDPRHIHAIAERQGAHGVTAIIPTIYSGTIRVMRDNMAVVREAIEQQRALDSGQAAGADAPSPGPDPLRDTSGVAPAAILGVHLEGPFLNPSRCGALNAMTFLDPSGDQWRRLVEGFEDIVRIVTIAPELPGAVNLIRMMSDSGIVVSLGHSEASYDEAKAASGAGARGVTHLFNAMSEFHHREPGLAGFGLLDPDIYVEVIADPYHLHEATIEMIFRLKRPDRIILVSDSVSETKTSSEPDGIADPHGTLLGGSMAITEAADLLREMGIDRTTVRKVLSDNPAEYLRIRPASRPPTR